MAVNISVSEFKAHCLELIEQTHTTHAEYIVTKRGRPVAKLVPIISSDTTFAFGDMKGSLIIKGDIVSPLPIDWTEGLE